MTPGLTPTPRLVALSIWADLRAGRSAFDLLTAVAARLGFARVLVPTDGVLAPDPALSATLAGPAEPGGARGRAELAHPRWSVPARPADAVPARGHDGALHIPTWPGRDVDSLLEAAAADGPPPSGIRVDLPASIGRTVTEADARANTEQVFTATGHPRDQGLFGTLEDAQERALRLVVGGATELCLIVPAADLLDHLAQLSAVAVGDLGSRRPGTPRSADPPPPPGWGGPGRASRQDPPR